jgi:hypothetical protein
MGSGIYLDEVQETSQGGFGLSILKLASTPNSQTGVKYHELIANSKLPQLSNEEIRAMFRLATRSRDDTKKSRRNSGRTRRRMDQETV